MNDVIITANIHEVEEISKPLIAFCVFIKTGNSYSQVDSLIRKYEGQENEIIDLLQHFAVMHGAAVFDLETSSKEVYKAALTEPGITPEILHGSQTTVTRALIETNREAIPELYGGEDENPEKSSPEEESELPGWKQWLISILKYFITKLEGGISYE